MLSYKRSLSIKLLCKKGEANILNRLPNASFFYSGSVRSGLLDVIDSLKILRGNIVLMPSFIAQGLVLPFQRRGIEIQYYHITEELAPDIFDVTKLIKQFSNKIKAIVLVHYFGIFQKKVYELKEICNHNNIILMEDCVHGLFSMNDKTEPIGSIGDISFFSLPKALPVPDGAIFFVNNESISINLSYQRSLYQQLSVLFQFVYLLLKRAEIKIQSLYLSTPINFISKILYYTYYYFLCKVKSNTKISSVTLRILKNIDYSKLIQQKILIYNFYEANLKISTSYAAISRKDNLSAVTSGYPIILDVQSDAFSKFMKKKGIEVLTYTKSWDYIPSVGEYKNEKFFLMHHVLLPINYEFTKQALDYIVTTVNSVINEDTN